MRCTPKWRRVDALAALRQPGDDHRAGGGGQTAQFLERVGPDPRPIGQLNADQYGALPGNLQLIACRIECHVRPVPLSGRFLLFYPARQPASRRNRPGRC